MSTRRETPNQPNAPTGANWVHRLVRHLSAWAWQREIELSDSMAVLEEMHARPGSMEISIKQNPAQAQWVAQCFASMVAASPNYTEMKFDLVAKGEKWEWLTVLIQKGNGKTPHQLRQEAEKERDKLRARLDMANVKAHRPPGARSRKEDGL
jgi:hypothetical protein